MLEFNLVEAYEKSFKDHWDDPALSDYNEKTYTYAETADRIVFLHYVFQKLNIKKGDHVALLGKNSANWCISYLAILTYGAVSIPILPDFQPSEIQHIIKHSDSKMLICPDQIYNEIDVEKGTQLKAVLSVDTLLKCLGPTGKTEKIIEEAKEKYLNTYGGKLSRENLSFRTFKNKDLASISYTSGTSGFSKGVMIPLNALSGNVKYGLDNYTPELPENARNLSFLPLAHCFGAAFDFLWPVAAGYHITILKTIPSPSILLKAFKQVRPNIIFSVPLILEKIYKKRIVPKINTPVLKVLTKIKPLRKLIFKKIGRQLTEAFGGDFFEIVIGGAPLNQDVEAALRESGLKFTVGYGMTECAPLIAHAHGSVNPSGACGKILPCLTAKIESHDPAHIPGELLVKGEHVMLGYYKNKSESEEVLLKDGWLRTGDLGIIDKNGFLHLKGRSKNLILGASGQNIYPEEIEAVLNNLPYVGESVVTESHQKIIALVHPDYDKMDEDHVSERALKNIMNKNRKILNEKIPAYAAVKEIRIVFEEFEKTPKKSIKRYLYNKIT